jgi:small subunit ribosomal protein S9
MADDEAPIEEQPEVEAEELEEAVEAVEAEAEAEAAEEAVEEAEEEAEAAEEAVEEAEEEAEVEEAVEEEVEAELEADEKTEAKADKKAAKEKPIPGADLEVDIVVEGDGNSPESSLDPFADDADVVVVEVEEPVADEPIAATIKLAADARYTATGKRKRAVARVILKPGKGEYLINGRSIDDFFPRPALQRNIRQPLEAVGFEDKMDVIARMHGGGVSAQAGALRHGISRALLEADPNLRGALKSRGFLTRDARAKERKKAGLKKARKRPQFSKR